MVGHFFFQAEDGIRDADVTGVQTCALPIYGKVLRRKVLSSATTKGRATPYGAHEILDAARTEPRDFWKGYIVRVHDDRSEERRVGKECRSRVRPYQSMNKKLEKSMSCHISA